MPFWLFSFALHLRKIKICSSYLRSVFFLIHLSSGSLTGLFLASFPLILCNFNVLFCFFLRPGFFLSCIYLDFIQVLSNPDWFSFVLLHALVVSFAGTFNLLIYLDEAVTIQQQLFLFTFKLFLNSALTIETVFKDVLLHTSQIVGIKIHFLFIKRSVPNYFPNINQESTKKTSFV